MSNDTIIKLPAPAKKIWLTAFKKAKSSNHSEEESIKIAWGVVRIRYKQTKDSWVIKSNVKIQTTIKKSGLFNPTYTLDLIIGSPSLDDAGQNVSPYLLDKFYGKDLIDDEGDIDHIYTNTGNTWTNGLFKAIKKTYVNGQIIIKTIVDKTHESYKWFIDNKVYNHIKGASAEYINPVVDGNTIVDADRMGWTVAIRDMPINPDSYIKRK